MKTIEVNQLPEKLAGVLDLVAVSDERITITRDGKPVAALVPIGDLATLEAIEDRIDVNLAKKALQENGTIAWSQLKNDLL